MEKLAFARPNISTAFLFKRSRFFSEILFQKSIQNAFDTFCRKKTHYLYSEANFVGRI